MKATVREAYKPTMSSDTACHAVLECTQRLVEAALQANWHQVLDGMEHRRQLLEQATVDSRRVSSALLAMHAAVTESERAMAKVVAHAIIGARCNGAEFAIRH